MKKVNTNHNSHSNQQFENTPEGRKLLLELSRSVHAERKQNEYNGEFNILRSFAKRNKNKYYTSTLDQDLHKMATSKSTAMRNNEMPQIYINHLNQSNNFLKSNFPRS